MSDRRKAVLQAISLIAGPAVALKQLDGAALVEAMVMGGVVWAIAAWCLFESARTHRVRERIARERLERDQRSARVSQRSVSP